MGLSLAELKALPAGEWEGLSPGDRERLGRHIVERSPDERELVDLTLRAKAALLDDFSAAIGAYLVMAARDDYDGAWDWVERLAQRWREAGEERQLEQFGDSFLTEEGRDLLAGLESSLVLALSPDEHQRGLRLDERELIERMVVVGQEGVWGDWAKVVEPARAELERRLGRSLEAGGRQRRQRGPALRRRKRAARARELVVLMDETLIGTLQVYAELAPDGRDLSEEERRLGLERLAVGAACVRRLDIENEVISPADQALLRPGHALLRSVHRSLVLALAEDPGRRAQAMSAAEAQGRASIANEQLSSGASLTEAWQAQEGARAPAAEGGSEAE